ncbi:MAG: AMP-binding protein [Nitrococcus sp.]|nr:AMP-binding protein [Nitrococcus sp.]
MKLRTSVGGIDAPLTTGGTGSPAAWWQRARISRELFLSHACQAAKQLFPSRFVINLCEDRYLFLVAFLATLYAGKINLLPPSRAKREVQRVAQDYADHQFVTDADIKSAISDSDAVQCGERIDIAADHLAAIVFTSGSTGSSLAHNKYWGDLVLSTHCAQRRFGFHAGMSLVATVPAQHMYGLETSILVPLVCGVSVHAEAPFYPADIHATLATVSEPRVLITTPHHLRVCVASGLQWPAVEFIVSATAPLTADLAGRAEELFCAPVLEIYGCTETGSIASRRTKDGAMWRTYDGVFISQRNNGFYASGRYLPEPVALNDWLMLHDETHFELAGRQSDLVNVAGKRASLADLNFKLNEIEGVWDGAFLIPDEEDAGNERATRLIALVVAPELSERQIIEALAERVDAVFLPRPLYNVQRLPRNALGKLPREAMLELARRLKRPR